MNTFEADHADGPEARTPSEMLAVLLEGSVPPQFRYPPKAIVSDCTAVTTVTSSLDSHGVDYFRDLLCREQPPDVRLVLLVHATCPTQEKDLLDLLTLLGTSRLRVWVLAVKAWGQRCTWVLCARRDSPVHVLWTSTAGDFGLLRPALDEAHLVTAADPLVVDQFIGWFSRVVAISTPLTPETARIPALVPAAGTREGAEIWDRYVACCRATASAANDPATDSPTSVGHPQTVSEQTVEAVEKQIRNELKIPKPDPMLPQLVRLFEKGDLVMIDKGSRIPPLDLPIKAEWFGIPSFREVGVVSRGAIQDLGSRRADQQGSGRAAKRHIRLAGEVFVPSRRWFALDAAQGQTPLSSRAEALGRRRSKATGLDRVRYSRGMGGEQARPCHPRCEPPIRGIPFGKAHARTNYRRDYDGANRAISESHIRKLLAEG